ncbi:MAG: hypothetical protein EON54_09890 [Alcaligenaceae bacterium]|nr:MAG: hypothetical protein EON54_09890 [Alcaligenaceae bacterium]
MRTIVLCVGFLTIAASASAQTILSREPLTLNPFAVVYVQGGHCGVGKVMKVTGMDRRQRKRACVTMDTASAVSGSRL